MKLTTLKSVAAAFLAMAVGSTWAAANWWCGTNSTSAADTLNWANGVVATTDQFVLRSQYIESIGGSTTLDFGTDRLSVTEGWLDNTAGEYAPIVWQGSTGGFNATGKLGIGTWNNAQLTIEGGDHVFRGDIEVVRWDGAHEGVLEMKGGSLTGPSVLIAPYAKGNTGRVIVEGGTLSTSSSDVHVGKAAGSVGELVVTGGTVHVWYWMPTGTDGASTATIRLYDGEISCAYRDGAFQNNVNGNGVLDLCRSTGSTALFEQYGGLSQFAGAGGPAVKLGAATGTKSEVKLMGGTMNAVGLVYVGATTASTNTLTVGTGSTLKTTGITTINATDDDVANNNVVIDGGTIQALADSGTFINGKFTVTIGENGGTIDANGHDITIVANLLDEGRKLTVINSDATAGTKTVKVVGKVVSSVVALGANIKVETSVDTTKFYWIGTDAGDWSDGANWSYFAGSTEAANDYPNDAADTVYIKSAAVITVNTDATIGTLDLGADTTLKGENTLTLTKLNGAGALTTTGAKVYCGGDLTLPIQSAIVNDGGDITISGQLFMSWCDGSVSVVSNKSGTIKTGSWLCVGTNQGDRSYDAELVVEDGTVSQTGESYTTLVIGSIGNGVDTSKARLTVNGGTVSTVNLIYVGERGTSTSIFTQNGGTVTAPNGVLFNAAGVAEINLNGGVLETSKLGWNDGTATSTINLNGGTIKATAAGTLIPASEYQTLAIGANGVTIDTDNAVTIEDVIDSAEGAIVKTGAGTLTFANAPACKLTINVQSGTGKIVLPAGSKYKLLSKTAVTTDSETGNLVFSYDENKTPEEDMNSDTWTGESTTSTKFSDAANWESPGRSASCQAAVRFEDQGGKTVTFDDAFTSTNYTWVGSYSAGNYTDGTTVNPLVWDADYSAEAGLTSSDKLGIADNHDQNGALKIVKGGAYQYGSTVVGSGANAIADLEIDGGALTINGSSYLGIVNATANYVQKGGTFLAKDFGNVDIKSYWAADGDSKLTVSIEGGSTLFDSDFVLGNNNTNGTATINISNGGLFQVGLDTDAKWFIVRHGANIVNINKDGILAAWHIQHDVSNGGTLALNFNGGTWRVPGSNYNGWLLGDVGTLENTFSVTLGAKGGTIDTATDAILPCTLTVAEGSTGLVKKGMGTLTLTKVSGTIAVTLESGKLVLPAGTTYTRNAGTTASTDADGTITIARARKTVLNIDFEKEETYTNNCSLTSNANAGYFSWGTHDDDTANHFLEVWSGDCGEKASGRVATAAYKFDSSELASATDYTLAFETFAGFGFNSNSFISDCYTKVFSANGTLLFWIDEPQAGTSKTVYFKDAYGNSLGNYDVTAVMQSGKGARGLNANADGASANWLSISVVAIEGSGVYLTVKNHEGTTLLDNQRVSDFAVLGKIEVVSSTRYNNSNLGVGIDNIVATIPSNDVMPADPVISVTGEEDDIRTVSITAEEGTTIYYYCKSAKPTEATVYTESFKLSANDTVYAYAVDGNGNQSGTTVRDVTACYTPAPTMEITKVDGDDRIVTVTYTASDKNVLQYKTSEEGSDWTDLEGSTFTVSVTATYAIRVLHTNTDESTYTSGETTQEITTGAVTLNAPTVYRAGFTTVAVEAASQDDVLLKPTAKVFYTIDDGEATELTASPAHFTIPDVKGTTVVVWAQAEGYTSGTTTYTVGGPDTKTYRVAKGKSIDYVGIRANYTGNLSYGETPSVKGYEATANLRVLKYGETDLSSGFVYYTYEEKGVTSMMRWMTGTRLSVDTFAKNKYTTTAWVIDGLKAGQIVEFIADNYKSLGTNLTVSAYDDSARWDRFCTVDNDGFAVINIGANSSSQSDHYVFGLRVWEEIPPQVKVNVETTNCEIQKVGESATYRGTTTMDVDYASELQFTVTADADYVVEKVMVGETELEPEDGVYKTMITDATKITATAIPSPVVTITFGNLPDNVTIGSVTTNDVPVEANDDGTYTVNKGSTVVITYKAATAYALKGDSTKTIENISGNVEISTEEIPTAERTATTFVYVGGSKNFSDIGQSDFTLTNGEPSPVDPGATDTVVFNSETALNINADRYYAAFVLNANLTITGNNKGKTLTITKISGAGTLTLGDYAFIRSYGDNSEISCPLAVTGAATVHGTASNRYFTFSGATLTGSGTLTLSEASNMSNYSGNTIHFGDASGFTGTITTAINSNDTVGRNQTKFYPGDYSQATVIMGDKRSIAGKTFENFLVQTGNVTYKFGSLSGIVATSPSSMTDGHPRVEIGALGKNDIVTGYWLTQAHEKRSPLIVKVGDGILTNLAVNAQSYVLNGGTLVVSSTDKLACTTEIAGMQVKSGVFDDGYLTYWLEAKPTLYTVKFDRTGTKFAWTDDTVIATDDYQFESGSKFDFKVTVDDDYDAETLVVTAKWGEDSSAKLEATDNVYTLTIDQDYTIEAVATKAVQPIEPGKGEGTVEVSGKESDSPDAIAGKVVIKSPDTTIVNDETYAGYFTKTATWNASKGKWDVTVTLTDDVKEAEEETEDLADSLTDIAAGTATSATITGKPGLWYSVKEGAEVTSRTEGVRTQCKAAGEVTLPITVKGGTAGFYQIMVNATDK